MMVPSLTMSRPSPAADLELIAPPAYEVIGFDPGEVGVQVLEVEGEYQHGSAVLGFRLSSTTGWLVVKMRGTAVGVVTVAQVLVAAARQRNWHLTYTTTGGAVHEYVCGPAAVQIVRGLDARDLGDGTSSVMVARLTFKRQPIPVQGVA